MKSYKEEMRERQINNWHNRMLKEEAAKKRLIERVPAPQRLRFPDNGFDGKTYESIGKAADELHVSKTTIHRWIRQGKLVKIKDPGYKDRKIAEECPNLLRSMLREPTQVAPDVLDKQINNWHNVKQKEAADHRRAVKAALTGKQTPSKVVKDLATGKVYPSIGRASFELGISVTSIQRYIQKGKFEVVNQEKKG